MTNTIIRASAGSGKTFQLSNRYLEIVFQDSPVETILASTFTRKAAGEILDRILQRLASASLDEAECRELAKFIAIPGSDPETTRRALQTLLSEIARNLYRLRISTLDSFFNKIASTFALELGFPPGWSILDENEYVRCLVEAIRQVLGRPDRDNIRGIMDLMQKGEQDRNVTKELLDLAKDYLPLVRRSTENAWSHTDLIREELPDREMVKAIEQFERSPVPQTGAGTDRVSFVKAKNKLVPLAMQGDWKAFLQGSTLASNAAAGEFVFDTLAVEGEMRAALEILISQAKAVLLTKLARQTLATRRLLDLIADACEEILLREGGFRFEDITERLARDDFQPTLASLAHRIDARTEHLLLDEFQDTSESQWKVLRPFALEASTLDGGSFFCVGDVKQAIYAWRGGVAGIFETIEREIDIDKNRTLDQSFRSSRCVIETVNRLFQPILAEGVFLNDLITEKNVTQADIENSVLKKYPQAALTWARRFKEHDAAKKTIPGSCVLEVGPVAKRSSAQKGGTDASNESEDPLFFDYTVERIAKLHQTRPEAGIGVLVARNKQIGELISGLKRLGIEASEEGGNPLTDSAAVQHVLSAMILGDHPGDRIARFHLANGPLAEYVGLSDSRPADSDRQAVAWSEKLRRELLTDGYGSVVERMVGILSQSCNPREFQRLERLLELAFRFQEASSGVRTHRFVEMVRTTKIESPSSSKIRIMTIHKSKGLEFDIVVLPDLNGSLVKSTPKLVVSRKTPTSPIDFVLRYASEEVQCLLPDRYRSVFESRIRGEVEEALSVLYVAMTRAIHELVMIVQPLGKTALDALAKGKAPVYPSSFAGILRASRLVEPGNADKQILFQAYYDEKTGYVTGSDAASRDWYAEREKNADTIKTSDKSTAAVKIERLDCQLAKKKLPPRNMPRISPSGSERFSTGIDSGIDSEFSTKTEPEKEIPENFRSVENRDDALLWGTAMHACFEHGLRSNPWLDRGKPNPGELEGIVRSAVMGKKGQIDVKHVVRSFLAICEQPNTRSILSSSNYPAGNDCRLEVRHERRFSVRYNDQLLHGSVDRLVIQRKNDRIVAVDIIDYKTDVPSKGSDIGNFLEERAMIYRQQMVKYREGMARLFRLEQSRISGKLLFVGLDRVVPVF